MSLTAASDAFTILVLLSMKTRFYHLNAIAVMTQFRENIYLFIVSYFTHFFLFHLAFIVSDFNQQGLIPAENEWIDMNIRPNLLMVVQLLVDI